jgi:hypothetical protein
MAKAEVATAGAFNLMSVYSGMDQEMKDEFQDELDDLGGGGIDHRMIKIPTGKVKSFTVESDDPDDPDTVKELHGVILFTHLVNSRWEGEYNGENRMPVCTSWDAKTGTVMATGEIIPCDRCPYNQFREDEDGFLRKVCKNSRRIYLSLDGKPQLYLLQVPPTSLKDTQKQLRRIMSGGKPYTHMVLSFTLTGAVSRSGQDYAKLSVSYLHDLAPEQVEITRAMRAEIRNQFKSVAITEEDYYDTSAGAAPAAPSAPAGPPQSAADDGFINIPEGIDTGLPFA